MQAIVDTLVDAFEWLLTAIRNFIGWIWGGIWDVVATVAESCYQWFLGLLPADWNHFISTNPWPAAIWEFADRADQFIPWKICVGIWIFSLMIVLGVRLGRWVLGIQLFGFGMRG